MSSVQIVPWTTLKDLLDTGQIDYSVLPTTNFYYVFTNGTVIVVSILPKDTSAETVDFETNYLPHVVDFVYQEINQYQNITGNGTTVVKSGPGLLRAIILNNNTTGGTMTVYDNTAASGTKIMTLQLGTPSGGLLSTSGFPSPCSLPALDVRFNTGLTVVMAGSSSNNVTVYYR